MRIAVDRDRDAHTIDPNPGDLPYPTYARRHLSARRERPDDLYAVLDLFGLNAPTTQIARRIRVLIIADRERQPTVPIGLDQISAFAVVQVPALSKRVKAKR